MDTPKPPFDPELIPNNRAHAWLRVILWILPTGFAWMSAAGLNMLSVRGGFPNLAQLVVPIWIVVNIIFVSGAGWYRAALLHQVGNVDWRSGRTVEFFAIQLLLIPFFSVIILFAICVANPIKF